MKSIYGILAVTGPQHLLPIVNELSTITDLNEIKLFPTPDDYGMFPDTSGYTEDNWQEQVLTLEDSNLYPYMTKCMDCVIDYTSKRSSTLDMLGYKNIETFIHWPKFGGMVYAVIGVVKGESPCASYLQ